jgi:hypothetical protein
MVKELQDKDTCQWGNLKEALIVFKLISTSKATTTEHYSGTNYTPTKPDYTENIMVIQEHS